ncbi:MAG: Signal transduction histidine kinase [Subtercola sp.]|nr:Signal transduction histidine kinase [Subtercola sp.]
MPWSDLAAAASIAFVATAIVGVVAVGVLLLIRRASLLIQLCVVVLATTVAVVASMISVANAMYLSAHDLTVAVTVASMAGVVSLALAAALGWMIVRNSRSLSALTRRIGRGEAVDHAGRHQSAELIELADELVLASKRLAEAQAQAAQLEASRRELVAWISHDLRTPLAGIRAMSESLEDGLVSDPTRYHRQIRSQVEQLTRLVDDLFQLSKLDSGTLTLTLEDVTLFDIVSDAVADVRAFSGDRDIRVATELGRDIVVRADARELTRAISNLLVNAVQHTPPGSLVTVSVQLQHGRAAVSVIDSGDGIAETDLARVFDAGWRGHAARTPTPTGGAGLGLAIVRGIAEAHHGAVSVQNVPGGCRFDLMLPTAV